MLSIPAAGFFAVGENGFVLAVLILAALILGLYLWGSKHRSEGGKAEHLETTYQTLSAEMLTNIPDSELVDAVAANLMAKLDKQKPDAYITIPLLSHGRCAVYSIWLTLHELKSDGLPSYIKSPSGRFLDLTADGMELIGAKNSADALRKVKEINLLDEESLLLQQDKMLQACDEEQIWDLCREYIRTNPDEFVDSKSPDDSSHQFDTSTE